MARDSATVKARNKRVRQEALRELLANKGLIQHVLEITKELNDESIEIDPAMVDRKKFVVNTKLKLIAKYLPDEKIVEIEGGENPVQHTHTVEFVGVSDKED